MQRFAADCGGGDDLFVDNDLYSGDDLIVDNMICSGVDLIALMIAAAWIYSSVIRRCSALFRASLFTAALYFRSRWQRLSTVDDGNVRSASQCDLCSGCGSIVDNDLCSRCCIIIETFLWGPVCLDVGMAAGVMCGGMYCVTHQLCGLLDSVQHLTTE